MKGENKNKEMKKLNAGGDDRNLVEHGDNAHYWYSINDMMTLLIHTRRGNLIYNNQVQPGEEYIAIRQNQSNIFLADPYHSTNFATYLDNDISRIIGNHEVPEQNNYAWQGNMPNLIVIPLLSGMHWRTIAIQINYETNTLNVTWDDPYGNFPQVLREELLQPIRESALNLINRHNQINNELFIALNEEGLNVVQHENNIDQQGRGSNGWDCGPITLTNIRDYVTHYAQNYNLNAVNYTISDNAEENHADSIRDARISHIEEYSQVAELPIDQNRLTTIRLIWEQDKKNKLETIDLKMNDKISSLDPFYLDMFFSVLENYKQFISKVDEQKAIKYALDFVQQEKTREIIKILSYARSNQPEEEIEQKQFSQVKTKDQLLDDLFKIFKLPKSLKSLQENEEHLATFLAFNSDEIPSNKDYPSTLEKVKNNILKEIFYFFDEEVEDFTYNLIEFIGESDLKKDILRYQSGFMKKFEKELGQKKSQDELLQMFLGQNLKELGLNPQFKIKKLADKGHANDVYLVSNTEIDPEDPTTIDYYAKTFSKDSKHTGGGLIDPREALAYKLLEYTGFGPKCWFLLKSGSSSMGTTSGGNFIITENLGKQSNFLLAKALEGHELFDQIIGDHQDNFALQISLAGVINDLISIADTFVNLGNYGVVYDSETKDFVVKFIDHLPNPSNGKFALMRSQNKLEYSPRTSIIESNENNFFITLVKQNKEMLQEITRGEILELISVNFKENLYKAQIYIEELINKHSINFYAGSEIEDITSVKLLSLYCNKILENLLTFQSTYKKSQGVASIEDGMADQDIELNLKLLKHNIESKHKQSSFYTEEKVLNKSNILDKVMAWHDSNEEQKHFLSIATVINSAGKKHALAVHIEKEYNISKVYIIDPLSCDKSEFKQEISDLQNILSILPGVSYQIYTGEQDINAGTCGDISLFELFNILNSKLGKFQQFNDKIFSDTAVVINNKIDYLFNEKLRAQTEYYLETGIVFETFRNAVENNQITILTTYNQNVNSLEYFNNITNHPYQEINYEQEINLVQMPSLDSVTNINTFSFDLNNIECGFKNYQTNFSLDSFSYNLATIYDFLI